MNLQKLIDYLSKMADLSYLSSILSWEMDTQSPKKSLDYLIKVKTDIEMQNFELSTNESFLELINNVINSDEYSKLSEEEQNYIKELKEDFERSQNIPADFYEEYCNLCSKSRTVWTEAKEKQDYQIFKPYLEKIIEATKKYYRYMYPEGDLYDHMLDTYEKDMTSSKIDILFDDLKNKIIPIVKKLNSNKEEIKTKEYSDEELLSSARYLLNYIGFDNERGTLGIYPHGYTNKLSNDDVRITFSNNKSIFDHVCTVIHEGGHGIFEQSIGPNLSKYPAYNVNKYALHESQSRFFENILGRNINFWKPIYNDIKEQLDLNVNIEDFVSQLNSAKPSLIRTEADELTYCLHIIIRYEIEREIFNGNIDFEELPNLWNKKVEEYLGIEVPNDSVGILQDVHWAEGAFGYFPSYLLGSILYGMLLETVNEKLGNVDELLSNGEIKKITNFLQENIHKYGGEFTFETVAKRVCNKELTVEPLVKYFESKYGE